MINDKAQEHIKKILLTPLVSNKKIVGIYKEKKSYTAVRNITVQKMRICPIYQ